MKTLARTNNSFFACFFLLLVCGVCCFSCQHTPKQHHEIHLFPQNEHSLQEEKPSREELPKRFDREVVHSSVERDESVDEFTSHISDSHAEFVEEIQDRRPVTRDEKNIPEEQSPEREKEAVLPSYPYHQAFVPKITASLKTRLRKLFLDGQKKGLNTFSFSKVGDSHTASNQFLAPMVTKYADVSSYTYLKTLVTSFSAKKDKHGKTSFDRKSLCATVGWSTDSPLKGNPSPISKELAEQKPSVVFVLYGSNDMYKWSSKSSIFETNLRKILDAIIQSHAIPVMSTIPALGASRSDKQKLHPTYNQIVKKIAQEKELPLIELHQALLTLASKGLSKDDIHLNTYKGWRGGALHKTGLAYGNNLRNKIVLDTLHKIWLIVFQNGPAEQ